MKKIGVYVLIIAALGIVAYKTIISSESTLSTKETRLALAEPGKVNKIIISGVNGEIELIMQNSTWMLNSKPANQQRIQQLLMLSSLLTVQSPVPISNTEKVNAEFGNGIEIEYYNQRRKMHSIQLCTLQRQLYARLSKKRNAYKISVSTFPNVDLTKLAEPTTINWADNILFDFSSDKPVRVNLSFPTMPAKGFHIDVDSNNSINLLSRNSDTLTQLTKSELLYQYLKTLEGIRFEHVTGIDTNNITNQAFFKLNIQTASGNSSNLIGYLKTDDVSKQINQRYFYGKSTTHGLILLNYTDFDPLLLPIDYFLKK